MLRELTELVILIRNIIILYTILKFFGYVNCQTESVNVELSETVTSEKLGSICFYVPQSAINELSGNNQNPTWDVIMKRLLVSQGIPMELSHIVPYTGSDNLVELKSKCDYNIYIINSDALTNIDYTLQRLMNVWRCTVYNYNAYFYEQKPGHYLHYIDKDSCSAVACPLDDTTLGIGCVSNNLNTYEKLSDDSAYIDTIDGVKYRMNISTPSAQCSYEDCELLYADKSSYVILASATQSIKITDTDLNPLTLDNNLNLSRFNFRKWWDIFYKIIQLTNNIIQGMSKRSDESYMYVLYR